MEYTRPDKETVEQYLKRTHNQMCNDMVDYLQKGEFDQAGILAVCIATEYSEAWEFDHNLARFLSGVEGELGL